MARLRRRGWLLTLSCVWLIGAVSAVAQDPPAADISCRLGASDGARRYRPGAWGVVEVLAANWSNEPAEAESVGWFVDDPTLQFGRRVMVPAHATLRTTCPIRVSEFTGGNAGVLYFITQQVIPSPREDRKQRSPQDAILASQPMILDRETPAVGIIGDFAETCPAADFVPYHTGKRDVLREPDELIYELVLAAKRARELSRRVSTFDAKDLPAEPAALDVLDVLVLSSDRLASDPGGIAMVRDWVLGGGRLWILLDEVRPSTVAAVMGDVFASVVVDRVGVTRLKMMNAQMESIQQTMEEVEVEQPVDLVRVVPVGVTITDTVNGWPAAFWQPMGAGRVYFTAVSAVAWMRPATGRDPQPRVAQNETSFFPREPLVEFAQECLMKRPISEIATTAFQPFLTRQIGYRILNRTSVTVLLGIFCGALVVAGVWFFRVGRPERMLWITPLLVAVASLVFVGIATATKKSVPPTAATMTRLTFEPGLGTGHSCGLVAMYNQEACSDRVGATRGGVFFPDMTALSGRRRRVVWTDAGTWSWQDLELPAGVRMAPFQRPVPLDVTVDCRARFGPTGLQGTLGPVSLTGFQDAVIAVPHQPVLGVKIDDQGAFTARPQDVLAPDDFSLETWLGDLQRRRGAVYQQIFATPPEMDAPPVPVLFAWAEVADTGFVFPQSRHLGSTLLSIPIRFQKSPPGSQVVIPAPFLPYRAVTDPAGSPPIAYTNVMHRWVESKLAVTDWLRFQLPPEVLPIRLSRATLTLTIKAASRSFQVLAVSAGQPVEVLRLSHPIGTYSVVLDREEFLQLDDEGGLRLVVSVGQDETATPLDQMSEAPWIIESMQLEVAGTVQGE